MGNQQTFILGNNNHCFDVSGCASIELDRFQPFRRSSRLGSCSCVGNRFLFGSGSCIPLRSQQTHGLDGSVYHRVADTLGVHRFAVGFDIGNSQTRKNAVGGFSVDGFLFL